LLLLLGGAFLAARPLTTTAEKAAPQETKVVVPGNTDFAFDLYGQLRTKDGNLFCSPYSISAALAMTSAGARGQTLDEMNKTLHFPDQDKLHPAHAALAEHLRGAPGAKRGYELPTANKLWGQKRYGSRAEL